MLLSVSRGTKQYLTFGSVSLHLLEKLGPYLQVIYGYLLYRIVRFSKSDLETILERRRTDTTQPTIAQLHPGNSCNWSTASCDSLCCPQSFGCDSCRLQREPCANQQPTSKLQPKPCKLWLCGQPGLASSSVPVCWHLTIKDQYMKVCFHSHASRFTSDLF